MSKYIKKSYSQMVIDSYNRSMEEDLRVEEIDDTRCMVINIVEGTMYNILMSDYSIDDCDCPHHVYRGVPCKHQYAAARYFGKSVI